MHKHHGHEDPREQPQHQPQRVPLLSNIELERGIGFGQGEPGRFSQARQNNGAQALTGITPIVNTMTGQANERGSIPDVCAQEIGFRYMLDNLAALDTQKDDMQRQWVGALCAYILSPLLLFGARDLYWRYITTRGLLAEHSDLGQALFNSITLPDGRTGREWRILASQSGGVPNPVLEYSPERLAVPSASLAEAAEMTRTFPWIDATGHFTDPLPQLSFEALLFLYEWLDFQLTSGAQANPTLSNALELLRTEVHQQLDRFSAQAPFGSVWQRILQALLLRNLVDTGIWVFRIADAVPETAFQNAMKDAPPDQAPMRTWDSITRRFTYGVMIDRQFVGFLDETQVLWLPAPGCLQHTQEYIKLEDVLVKHLSKPSYLHAYRSKLSLAMARFPLLRGPLQASVFQWMTGWEPARQESFSPAPRRLARDDVALLAPPFDMMSSLYGYYDANLTLFTPVLRVYKGIDEPLNNNAAYGVWNNVKPTERYSLPDEPAASEKALLPLTACAATILRNSEAQQYTPKVEILHDAQQNVYTATITIPQGNVLFTWSASYAPNAVQEGDYNSLPAVGYWPDGAAVADDPQWHTYYTYINFHEGRRAQRSSAVVYDVAGVRLSPNAARPITQYTTGGIHYAWQTQLSARQPSFCILEDDGLSIGCVLFGKPRPFDAVTHEAVVSIDFGTTSTTGAVELDKGDPRNIRLPGFTNSVIHWVMNKTQGVNWCLHQFIADRFNRAAEKDNAQSFFTAIARFNAAKDESATPAPAGSKLYIDGHIYFYGSSIHEDNLMENPRFFSLKLKNISDPNSTAGSNIKLFLQQVIETYLLYCRINGAIASEIRFAYPLAFPKDKQDQFRAQVGKLVARAARSAGMPNCVATFTSESQAVCAYFSSRPGIMRGKETSGIITLDIGGGTSDFSYCRQNPDQTLCYCYSNTLGGHLLVGEYVYHFKTKQDDRHPNVMNWFYDGCDEVAKTKAQKEQDDIHALVDELASTPAEDHDRLIFVIERFISLNPPLYGEILLTNSFREQYTLLLFELTLLLWFGYLLGTQPWAQSTPGEVCMHVGGNGAHLYDMIRREDRDAIEALVPPEGAVGLALNINPRRKREVAEGLLQTSDLLTANPNTCQIDCPQSPQELWEAFAALCRRFLKAFDGRKGPTTDYLRSLLAEKEERTRTQFLQECTGFAALCVYLPAFCDMMIEDLVTNR